MSSKKDKLDVMLSEKYGAFDKEVCYMKDPDKEKIIVTSKKNTTSGNIEYNLKKFFQEIFLPQGYPASVSPDYTRYQIWDTAQAFCSTITGTLSTHAVMKGVGVGDTEATPLAATVTWVLKEATGNVGRIAFAWWKGTSLDADSKKWRLVADILNDAAICLEVALPLFHGYTTYVLCLSTAMKAIVGVAGGATRAALTQHQAIRGNLADVSAKDGSQETAVNLIASIVAIFIISLVGQHIWPVFIFFTTLHLMSNYYAVSSVCLNTFNATRFLYCMTDYLSTNQVLNPEVVNKAEPVTFIGNKINDMSLYGFKIRLGASLQSFVESCKMKVEDLQITLDATATEKYLLFVDIKNKCIYIILHETAISNDIILAYYHATLYCTILGDVNREKEVFVNEDHPKESTLNSCKTLCSEYKSYIRVAQTEGSPPTAQFYEQVNTILKISWCDFKKKAEKSGWNFEKNLLICDEWRGNWKRKND